MMPNTRVDFSIQARARRADEFMFIMETRSNLLDKPITKNDITKVFDSRPGGRQSRMGGMIRKGSVVAACSTAIVSAENQVAIPTVRSFRSNRCGLVRGSIR